MNYRRIVKIFFIISILVSLISFFPMVLNFIFLIRDRDVIIHYKEYDKKRIDIDSIRFEDNEGGDTEWVYGYSKELDNYRITILFNSVKESKIRDELGMNENGKIKKDVWFREKSKYAYPAEKSDETFPIKTFLFNHLKLSLLWVVSILISILLYKIAKKRKMFNNLKSNGNE